jgi:hypothetical protein
VAVEQVLQWHDQAQLWVDLTLEMTKQQMEEHEWQQAIQATAKQPLSPPVQMGAALS